MKYIMPLSLLLAGLTITVFGIYFIPPTGPDQSRVFTGTATDKAVLAIMLGTIVAALGLTRMVRAWRRA